MLVKALTYTTLGRNLCKYRTYIFILNIRIFSYLPSLITNKPCINFFMTEIEKTAQAIGELSKKYQKPILCSFIGGTMVAEGEQILDDYKIPSYRFPERAISALAAMWKYKQHLIIKTEETSPRETNLDFSMAKTLFFQAQNHKQKTLDCFDINKLLISIGLSAPATTQVSNFDEARSFVRDWGYPIVLKINSLGLLHKTDIDGVVTNISRETELSEAVEKLQAVITKLNAKANIQAQKDIENGVEVIVGVKRDPTFGPILLFGAGGTLSELLVDRNLFLLPIDLPSAKKLVLQSKIYTLLKGYRGGSMLALERLYDLMVRLAKLAEEFPEITEIEINPVIVTHDDTYAVDGKIILQ